MIGEKISLGGVDKITLALLILAVLIRFAVMPFTFHPWESQTWANVGKDILEDRNPYEVASKLSGTVAARETEAYGFNVHYEYYAYPPLWAMIQYPFYYISPRESVPFSFGGNPPESLSFMSNFLLKLPLFLFDFIAAFAIFKILKRLGVRRPWLGVWLWLFNPLLLIVSAVWGHFDTVPVCFSLLAIWMLISKRMFLSGLMLGAAIGAKMYPIILFPAFVLFALDTAGKKGSFVLFISTIFSGLLLSMPFVIDSPTSFFNVLIFHGERIGGGLSLYSLTWVAQPLLGLSALELGYQVSRISLPTMIWGLLVAYSFVYFFSKRTGEPILIFHHLTFLMGVFFVTTKLVNEPYPLWILSFILIISLTQNKFKFFYILMTCIPIVFLAIHTPATDFFRAYWGLAENIREFLRSNELYVNILLSLLAISFFSVVCILIYRVMDAIALSSE